MRPRHRGAGRRTSGSRSTPARPTVAEAAVAAGATLVNDVSASLHDGRGRRAASAGWPCTCRASPRTMQDDPRYDDVVAEVRDFLVDAGRARPRDAGVDEVWIDPGIGFGKTARAQPRPARPPRRAGRRPAARCVVGTSRKGFLGALLAASDGVDEPCRPTTGSRARWPRPRGRWPQGARDGAGPRRARPRCRPPRWSRHASAADGGRDDGHEGQVGPGHRAPQLRVGHQGPARRVRAAGRLRRQPPPGPPPGGDHLDPRAGLHLRDLAASRRRTTCTTTTSSASPGSTGRSAPRRRRAVPGRPATRSCASCWPTASKVLVHGEELGDRICGLVAGYLLWTGLVPDGPRGHLVDRAAHCTASSGPAGSRAAWRVAARARVLTPADRDGRPRSSCGACASSGICGVLPEEQERPQPLEVDLDLDADLSRRRRSDDLADTVDYGARVRGRRAASSPPSASAAARAPGRADRRGRAGRRRGSQAVDRRGAQAAPAGARSTSPPPACASPDAGRAVVTRAFLGLGSNLGDRARYLRDAVDRAGRRGAWPCRRVYETEPVGGPEPGALPEPRRRARRPT